jgi:glutamate decarboxylase
MPHLASVVNAAAARAAAEQAGLLPKFEDFSLGPASEDEFTASVYGSKFAAADIPKHEMPEGEMPRDVAYRLIKDDLTLDGVPTLKLVSYKQLTSSH